MIPAFVAVSIIAVFGWLLFYITVTAYGDLAAECRAAEANLDSVLNPEPEPTPLFDQTAADHPWVLEAQLAAELADDDAVDSWLGGAS